MVKAKARTKQVKSPLHRQKKVWVPVLVLLALIFSFQWLLIDSYKKQRNEAYSQIQAVYSLQALANKLNRETPTADWSLSGLSCEASGKFGNAGYSCRSSIAANSMQDLKKLNDALLEDNRLELLEVYISKYSGGNVYRYELGKNPDYCTLSRHEGKTGFGCAIAVNRNIYDVTQGALDSVY